MNKKTETETIENCDTKTVMKSFRMTKEEYRYLYLYAATLGISFSELVRIALEPVLTFASWEVGDE